MSPRKTSTGRSTHRAAGLPGMRALAHPIRMRMMHLLRAEPLSASELARRLGIRFGSAQYHLRTLERAGIALRVGERSRRGGTEILFEVPHGLWVEVEPDASPGVRQAMNRAYVAELLRRMDEAATQRHEVDHDVLSTRELELDAEGIEAANEAVHAFLHRLDELALSAPRDGSTTFTAATILLQMPGRHA